MVMSPFMGLKHSNHNTGRLFLEGADEIYALGADESPAPNVNSLFNYSAALGAPATADSTISLTALRVVREPVSSAMGTISLTFSTSSSY